jgi:hypothetical protein
MSDENDSVLGFIRSIGARKKEAKINDAQKNYINDPMAAINAVNEIDSARAMELQDKMRADQAAMQGTQDAAGKRYLGGLRSMATMLRKAHDPANPAMFDSTFDSLAPVMERGFQMKPEEIMGWKEKFRANPKLLDNLIADADQKLSIVGPGSNVLDEQGNLVHSNPGYAKAIKVRNGDGSESAYAFDPESGTYSSGLEPTASAVGQPQAPATGAPAAGRPKFTGQLTVDAVAPHFIAQESDGDYGAVNASSGALGAYQVMPATGAALAKRLGVKWAPELMAGEAGRTPRGKAYQDQIGRAAIQEAIDNSGGDPEIMARYYQGGSNRKGWGPNNDKYAKDMLERLGGDTASAPVTLQPAITGKPKPPAEKKPGWSDATRQQKIDRGLDPDTPYQVSPKGKFEKIGERTAGKGGVKSQKAAAMSEYLNGKRQEVIGSIDRLIPMINDNTVGSLSAKAMRLLPGTDAKQAVVMIEAIKSNIGFSELQAMRNSSQTGGALGNVAVRELDALQASLGNLDPDQKPEELLKTVRKIRTQYQRLQSALSKDAQGEITIRNPKTGEVKVLRNGKWESM